MSGGELSPKDRLQTHAAPTAVATNYFALKNIAGMKQPITEIRKSLAAIDNDRSMSSYKFSSQHSTCMSLLVSSPLRVPTHSAHHPQ